MIKLLIVTTFALIGMTGFVYSQQTVNSFGNLPRQLFTEEQRQKMERGRIGIVTGSPAGTYIQLGADLQRLVESSRKDDLRVIVMVGRGSVGNLIDLSFLRYTDFALVQSDVLTWIKNNYPSDFDYMRGRVAYVAPFHQELVHIVARGAGLKTMADLQNKRVAIGTSTSGTAITATTVFDGLSIPFTPVYMNETTALNDLLSDNPSIDAMVYVAGRKSSLFTNVSAETQTKIEENDIHFVPLTSSPPRDSPYKTTTISDEDYQSFIPFQQSVETWSVPAVLAVYDWKPKRNKTHSDRYRRTEAFIRSFFENRLNLNDGAGGYNENWCTVDIGRTVGGWKRAKAAQDWLDANSGAQTNICGSGGFPPDALQCDAFTQDMKTSGIALDDPTFTESLYLKWQESHPGECR